MRAELIPECSDSRLERTYFGPERVDFEPERANFGSEKVDFRPRRTNFLPEGLIWGLSGLTSLTPLNHFLLISTLPIIRD